MARDIRADVPVPIPKAVREVALEKDFILFDLHQKSEQLIIQYGEENSKKLFLHIEPGEYPSLPEGLEDNTHFSPDGTFRICDLAAEEIRLKVKELALFLKD